MSLMTGRVVPLALGVIHNTLNQFPNQLDEISSSQVKEARPKKENAKNFRDAPNKPPKEIKLSPLEATRELNENERRQSVVAALLFLKTKKLLRSLTRNLKKIIDSRGEEGLGFKSKVEVSKEDLFIRDTASALHTILKTYPTYQNVQVVMGFVEMIHLIDNLESIGIENERNGQGFGFHPSLRRKENLDGELSSEEAYRHAKKLRAKLPTLLDWLEVPVANLRVV